MGEFGRFLLLGLILSWNLDLSRSFCPPPCGCNDVALSVDCHSAGNLRVVPIFLNPQIKFLSLAQNQIKEISMSLQFYSELQFLDISQNEIGSLGTGNFENLGNLRVLNSSFNSIKVIEDGVFMGLARVEVLDLSGNQMERVEREALRNLKVLREIILDRNRLESLDWDLFRELDNLEHISVRYNFLQTLEPFPTPSYWTLKKVRSLDVSHNQLTRVRDEGLGPLQGLRDLNLCCNYIHTIEARAFDPAEGHLLERVNLSRNRLGRVPTEPLEKLGSTLRQLDLSSNRISDQLENHSFRSLFQLQILRLSDNPALLRINEGAFVDNVNLVHVEADHLSNLSSLSPVLLANKPKLEVFSLTFAQISSLSADFFKIGEVVGRSLRLDGNPLDCNCSALPLFNFINSDPPSLNSSDPTFSSSVITSMTRFGNLSCTSPSHLQGVFLRDLKPSDFSHCFTPETADSFQVLVITIAACILSLLAIVAGVKLCCLTDRHWRCRDRKDKPEKLLDIVTLRRELPPPPIAPTLYGKSMPPPTAQTLFYGAGNGNCHPGSHGPITMSMDINGYHSSRPPPLPSKPAPPLLLHYEYQPYNYNDYSTSKSHRMKQVPSVLV